MNTVEVSHIYKSYGGKEVVKDVSFTVGSGEIFGLVGPNGAGKTTTIRAIMDIIKPDSGNIRVLGQKAGDATKNRIGYLPEERGLYRKLTVTESLLYLASLKSVARRRAQERSEELLQRIGMYPHRHKKVDELSRGMSQLIQFAVTILHDPELVILDEPFAGLDPVNVRLIKEMVTELRGQDKAVMLSTHMMNEVQEMCDRVLMIHRGEVVLYGRLEEIRARYRGNSVLLESEGELDGLEGVAGRKDHGHYIELFLDGRTSAQKVLAQLLARNVVVHRFEVATPSMNEIFLQVVEKNR